MILQAFGPFILVLTLGEAKTDSRLQAGHEKKRHRREMEGPDDLNPPRPQAASALRSGLRLGPLPFAGWGRRARPRGHGGRGRHGGAPPEACENLHSTSSMSSSEYRKYAEMGRERERGRVCVCVDMAVFGMHMGRFATHVRYHYQLLSGWATARPKL